MKRVATLLLAICFALSAFSSPKSFTKIDAYAKATPQAKAVSVAVLAKYLVLPAKNDTEKVRAIFSWITSHITYDWAAYTSGTSAFEDAATVLKKRTGVCQNFADLFTALCTQAGITAQTISGYAKSNVDNSWMLNGFGSANHAWNVVKINGNWQLMDVTWAECTASEDYFMANPYQFRKEHLPSQPEWQLTKDTLTLTQYENTPIQGYGFEKYSVTGLMPLHSCIKGKKKVVFEFNSPVNFAPVVDVRNFDYTDKSVPKFTQKVSHTGYHYKVEVSFLSEKIYWVELSGGSYFDNIAKFVADTHTIAAR